MVAAPTGVIFPTSIHWDCRSSVTDILGFFLKDFIYLFLERGEGREKEMEGNISRLPLAHPHLGTWPATQACALAGNQTGNLSVHRAALNPLNHTSQGYFRLFKVHITTLSISLGAWNFSIKMSFFLWTFFLGSTLKMQIKIWLEWEFWTTFPMA